jgi:hypothetical protein
MPPSRVHVECVCESVCTFPALAVGKERLVGVAPVRLMERVLGCVQIGDRIVDEHPPAGR